MSAPLLEIRGLHARFGDVRAVDGASLVIGKGERVALVGESGSGKSATALSVMRLLPFLAARHSRGEILFKGRDLMRASEEEMLAIRGDRIAMIFQEPMSSLNPLHRIERQIGEALRGEMGSAEKRARVLSLLIGAGLRSAESRLSAYPHELSGGERQRVMIAAALANAPDLLIADEPTTALDVTVQARILKLLRDQNEKTGMAVFFITHDLDLVRSFAERVYVMRRGRIVEAGEVERIFASPRHAYTRELVASRPPSAPPSDDGVADGGEEILRGEGVTVRFAVRSGFLRRARRHFVAVDGASLSLRRGRTLGVVGESGSGKTSLALYLLRLISGEGRVFLGGRDFSALSGRELRRARGFMQVVFQDPYGSLSPRMTVGRIITEGLEEHRSLAGEALRARAGRLLEEVGLEAAMRDRYPHEFSGGQRQRIAIARALALSPEVVILDEPTSGLDMTVQARIVALLRDLQARRGLSYVFISHNLKLVRALAHDLCVMRGGRIVEMGSAGEIFARPSEAYTRELLASAFL